MATSSKFPKEDQLGEASIETRVDLAKVAAYAVFSEEKSANDFYFENLLNCFIALVQYPVSFVVLKKGKVAFHVCHDKEHYQSFSAKVEKVRWTEDNSFELFQRALGSNYRIAVYLMHTKKFETRNKIKLIKRSNPGGICKSPEQYVSACAAKFFESEWYGFESKFAFQAKGALEASLGKLAKTYVRNSERIWPQPAKDIFDLQKAQHIDHPNTDSATWHGRVDELLSNVINDSRYGIRAFTGINHVAQGDNVVEPCWDGIQPPNMLVAYRSYTRRQKARDAVKPRHVTTKGYNQRQSGYAHNVNFVVPVRSVDAEGKEDSLDPYSMYFRFLKRNFSGDWRNLYEAKDSGRLLYGNLFDALVEKKGVTLSKTWKKKIATLQMIGQSADERFWETLGSGRSGVKQIAEILRSQVGDYARSMADPLFSTGIIHINPGYEIGGLDRILYAQLDGRTSFDELEPSVQNDVLRIVAVYYYFSGAAAWAGNMPRAKDPRKLCIMLLPIKMRGAVWGASAHAFYLESYEQMFMYNSTWLSNFLLATSGRQKFQSRFDSILWDAVQQRVLDLLVDNIGRTRSPFEFLNAIEQVNNKIRGEQLLVPYALPQFTVGPAKDASSGHEKGVWYAGHMTGIDDDGEKKFVRLEWTIAENEFYSARQPWSRRGTRSFLNVVDLGLRRGLEQMKSRMQEDPMHA